MTSPGLGEKHFLTSMGAKGLKEIPAPLMGHPDA